nr:hypothetical protein [Tanacetum cinerariifolium]
MRPDPNVPFSREGNRVNKVTITMNGSSLGLSFAPKGAGLNPVCDNHKAFDHRISRDPTAERNQFVLSVREKALILWNRSFTSHSGKKTDGNEQTESKTSSSGGLSSWSYFNLFHGMELTLYLQQSKSC